MVHRKWGILLDPYQLDPGLTIYNIKPLVSCGKYIDWSIYSPNNKLSIVNDITDKNIINNGILLLNRLSKENKDLLYRIHCKLLTYKANHNKLSVWYDFENHMFLNY